jgi:hypothetical protein
MNNKFIVTDKRTPALGKVIFFFWAIFGLLAVLLSFALCFSFTDV